MKKQFSARQVRSLMGKAHKAKSTGVMGACIARRTRSHTIEICREMTEEACDLVDAELQAANEGHASFFANERCR